MTVHVDPPTSVDAPQLPFEDLAPSPPDPAGGAAAPSRGPRRLPLARFGPRSLTGRLVTGVVVLVTVLVLAIGASTFFLLKSFLYERLDGQVRTVSQENFNSLQKCVGGPSQNAAGDILCQLERGPLRLGQTEWIAFIFPNGQSLPLATSQDLKPLELSPSDITRVVAADGTPATVQTSDGLTLRVAAAGSAGTSSFMVVTGLSLDPVEQPLGRVLLLLTSIGAGAVTIALVASYAGVSFGLKGLRRVTNTAQDVTAELSSTGGGLDRRVPVDAATDAEVGQLATSVNTLLGAVQTQFAARVRSEERMREFLADASHELRTPLTSIRGFAELSRLQRRQNAVLAGLDPTAAQDDALDRIESEGTRMSKLVDDLLLLARSDHGAPSARERVEVADMVGDVVDSARVAHPDRPIESAVPPGLGVLGDRDQLLRVVRNLVTNAAVHTAPGGPILVSAYGDGDEVVIQVADSGPGLPPDQAAHVFDRFWRADKARTRVRGGSGLGMSIVATIVEHHQGAVRFDSTPATGSTVTVVLPAAPPGSWGGHGTMAG